jgi:tetratricopeptide (TPR) repeat protein
VSTSKDHIRASAQKFLQKGQFDKAIKEFERLVTEDPKDVRTLSKIAELHAKLGANLKAIETYNQVAKVYTGQGFFLKAVAVYKQVLGIDPKHSAVLHDLGVAYEKLGLISEAISQYHELLALYQRRGSKEDVDRIQAHIAALASHTPSLSPFSLPAVTPVSTSSAPQPPIVIKELSTVPEISPPPVQISSSQSGIEIAIDDEAESDMVDFAKDMHADLTDVIAELEEGEPFEAMFEAFKKGVAQQIDTQDYDSHYNLGIAYKEMGLLNDAIREFTLATQSTTYEIAALTMLGLCFMEQGNMDEASNTFLKGLNSERVSPYETTNLRFEIGCAYESMGRMSEATRFYKKVSEADPVFRDVAARLKHAEKASRHSKTEGSNTELDILLEDVAKPPAEEGLTTVKTRQKIFYI